MTQIGQMIFNEGVEKGIEQGIGQGITQGEKMFAELTRRLIEDKRTDDLLKSTHDEVFREKLYQEYGMKK